MAAAPVAHGRRGRGHRLCDRRGGEYRAYQRTLFLAYGLVKGAYLGTEAMGSLAVYGAKALTFRAFDALPLATLTRGLVIGASLMAGAFIAKRLVLRIDATRFDLLMDALLLAAGLSMLGSAVQTVAS